VPGVEHSAWRGGADGVARKGARFSRDSAKHAATNGQTTMPEERHGSNDAAVDPPIAE